MSAEAFVRASELYDARTGERRPYQAALPIPWEHRGEEPC